MWKPPRIVCQHRYIDKPFLSKLTGCLVGPLSRDVNDGYIGSKTYERSGWFTRKGTQPGVPASWPDKRVIGVDLNLQLIYKLNDL